MMYARRSYFFRSLVMFVVAVAAPLMGLLAYTLLAMRHEQIAATKMTLRGRADMAARLADSSFQRFRQGTDMLASRRDLLLAGPVPCSEVLHGVAAIYSAVTEIMIVDQHGKPLCQALHPERAQGDVSRSPWFQEALAQPSLHISRPFIDPATDRWTAVMTRPLLGADGQPLALLAVGMDLLTLADRLLPMTGLPEGTNFAIVARDGMTFTINGARERWMGRQVPAHMLQQFVSANSRTIEVLGVDGRRRVLTSVPMQQFGMHVVISVPRDAVMALVEQQARRSWLLAALIVAAALLLAGYLARQLSRPVVSLTRSAREFGEGNLDASADETLPGEFRILAREFNKALAVVRVSEEASRARAAAEAASQAKSDFLANMSHEIRTPMNAVIGMTDLALRQTLPPRARDYVLKVQQAARNLLGIINDILDFSKIEAGKLELESVEFSLQEVMDRVTTVVGLQARKKDQELLFAIAADVPACMVGDPLRLEQVLVNLCGNAVKFTGPGKPVVVSVQRESDECLRFVVRDGGPGLSEAQIAEMFKPFEQLDASTTRKHGGTGLGLAICRQLVELMGGEIGVCSQLGHGSEFFFTLKVQGGRQPAGPSGLDLHRFVGLRVLVVDDQPEAQQILVDALSWMGMLPKTASNGHHAEEALRLAAEPFHVVLVDLKLPDTDGFSLIERLRALGHAARRCVLMTTYGNDEVSRQVDAQGLGACLYKPVSRRALADALEQALAATAIRLTPRVDAPAGPPAALAGASVLVVEDTEFNQIVAEDLLGSVAGMHVTIAPNGPTALQALALRDFDVVLMDVQMPDMDGYETTRRIRQMPQHAALTVIAMTAYAMPRDRQRCLEAGMNDFITKPVEPAELFAVLSRWVTPRPGDATPALAPPDDPAKAGSRPAAVDAADGLRRCLGRQELYERIVQRFVETRSGGVEALRQALRDNDRSTMLQLAHTTLSSAATLGALALSGAARALQTALISEADRATVQPLAEAMVDEYQRALVELQELARRQRSPLSATA